MNVGKAVIGAFSRLTMPPSWSVAMNSGHRRAAEPCSRALERRTASTDAMLSLITITPPRW
jgi:hypothetical protein